MTREHGLTRIQVDDYMEGVMGGNRQVNESPHPVRTPPTKREEAVHRIFVVQEVTISVINIAIFIPRAAIPTVPFKGNWIVSFPRYECIALNAHQVHSNGAGVSTMNINVEISICVLHPKKKAKSVGSGYQRPRSVLKFAKMDGKGQIRTEVVVYVEIQSVVVTDGSVSHTGRQRESSQIPRRQVIKNHAVDQMYAKSEREPGFADSHCAHCKKSK